MSSTPPDEPSGESADCRRHLDALFGNASPATFVELRFRTDSGMGRAFYRAGDLDAVAAAVTRFARLTDVFVGVLPRRRQASTRADLAPLGHVLWADCDSAESAVRLADFSPAPSLVIASGGYPHNRHGYWLLREPVSIGVVEAANRRLAALLGADDACADPGRVLRPAGTLNRKHGAAVAVRLVHFEASVRRTVEDVVGAMDHDTLRVGRPRRVTASPPDPLLRIDPATYVERLTGLHVPRNRKVPCPFHGHDRTPSLHVYAQPERGWFCFGCRRGGSIFDFMAATLGLSTRGGDFIEVADALCAVFGPDDLVGPASR